MDPGPPIAVVGQRGVRVGQHLLTQRRLVVGADGARPTGADAGADAGAEPDLGGDPATPPPLGRPADAEGAVDLGRVQAGVAGVDAAVRGGRASRRGAFVNRATQSIYSQPALDDRRGARS